MAGKANARRYAQAVFEIALEKQELDRWQTDLQQLAAASEEAGFLAALDSPKIKTEDKTRLLRQVFGNINPLAVNLVLLLVAGGGAGLVKNIAEEYGRLLDEHRGVRTAQVTAAVVLDEAEKQALAERLSALLGARVVMQTEVDPAILGGFIARAGGKLLDGSTRSKLAVLKRELEGGK